MKIYDSPIKDILEPIPVMISFHGLDYDVHWANKAHRRFTGLSINSIKNKKCYTVWRLGKPCHGCPVKQVIQTGRTAELKIPDPGQVHWPDTQGQWLLNFIPITDETGRVTGVVETAVEITPQKEAQLALRESEFRLQRAQHLAHIGHWELNIKTNQLIWSDEIFSIFEIEPLEFGASYEAFLNATHPDDREMVHQAYTESIINQTPYVIEHRLLFPDDRIKYVQERCRHYYDNKGEPIRSMGTVQDITENKLIEEENKKLQAKFVQAQKMESVGRLAGGVAHDFNNMLCVILGHLDIALDEIDATKPLHGTLLEVQNAAQRSASLTRQLLAFARQQPIAPKVIDLNRIISRMLKMLSRLIGEDIELAWIPSSDLGWIKIDPSQVDQILANLCVNARDAIEGVGKITIETKNASFDDTYCADHPGFLPGAYIMLAVSDNGCGMDQKVLSKLFDPFFTTKELGKGTGLGLATIYGIVKQNNGFINVYSEPGKGTTFRIYLSRYDGDAKEDHSEDVKHEFEGGTETVLLVEDEIMILNFCSKMLKKFGYQVLAANTPTEALELAETHKGTIDLLITDVVMMEMSGSDLAAQLETTFPGIKTLYMSGYTANVIAHHGLLNEGIVFLQKPFSGNELAIKIRKALNRK